VHLKAVKSSCFFEVFFSSMRFRVDGSTLRSMVMSRQNADRGFSLIELIIVLAIVAGGIALILHRQAKTEEATRVSDEVQSISFMVSKIKSFFASTGSYETLTSSTPIQMSLLNAPLKLSGTDRIVDAWGNSVEILGNAAGASPSFAVTIGGASMGRDTCAALASALAGGADSVSVGQVSALSALAGTAASGTISGGSVYKSSSNVTNIQNLGLGCSSANAFIGLQFH
jgi:prepilin-type N-terminal cleavage/methylation domain-containing protein